MAKPRKVILTYYDDEGEESTYEGRLLGVVGPKHFHAILTDEVIARRVETSETVSVRELSETIQDIQDGKGDWRVVVSVRKKGDENLNKKCLFISPKITYFSYYNGATKSMGESLGIVTDLKGWLMIEEDPA